MRRYLVILDELGELDEIIFEKDRIIKILEDESSTEAIKRKNKSDSTKTFSGSQEDT